MIFEVLVILTLVSIVFFLPTAKVLLRRYKLASKFAGPPALPILGNAFVYQGKQPHEYADILYSFVVKYGDCYRIWLGPELNLFFSSLKDIEAILGNSRFNEKSSQYDYLKPWLNQGLLISENRKWIRRRKIINPAFHFRTLEQFVHIFDKHSRRLVKALQRLHQERNQVELYRLFSLTALDVICVILVICFQIKYGRFIKLGNKFPGPPIIPIFGNALIFINNPVEFNMWIIGEFLKQYGGTFRVWLGNELNIFFQDRKDLEVILGGMLFVDKAIQYDLMNGWLNEGLLISRGRKWHNRRKIITPGFHFKILSEYFKVFEKQAKIFCTILEKQSETFELHELVSRHTLDVISGMSLNEYGLFPIS